jgi:16S rRNA (cytidine1402-2'-O)-methyltransferase
MNNSGPYGSLYLVPTPLAENGTHALPEMNRQIMETCVHFVTETPKTGRRHVRALLPHKDLQSCHWYQLNKHTPSVEIVALLKPALQGQDICLISDAGSPTMADPGWPLVAAAHRHNIKVVPLSVPSAMMLALMASGLPGQQFCFHGYLPPQTNNLKKTLKKLEQDAHRGITQIFMETPYRNEKMLATALDVLQDHTALCIACDLTHKDEYINTRSVLSWKKEAKPSLHKRPCIFLLGQTH